HPYAYIIKSIELKRSNAQRLRDGCSSSEVTKDQTETVSPLRLLPSTIAVHVTIWSCRMHYNSMVTSSNQTYRQERD
ncbi:cysteine-rich venom protein VAR4, partial [Biomphalaria pfeifferi]